MNIPAIIGRKRDGLSLSAAEWNALIDGFMTGDVAPEQMSALLMAGVIQGFTTDETHALTTALLESGERLDLSSLPGPIVDKHSTGGVADTTTLIVGPILATAGVQVAKLSGAGLGHTGGTLDKLAAIPGFRTQLSVEQMLRQVAEVGIAVCSASAELAPADKRLYALRDVTGTVPSSALIAASVMSKKLAAGAPNIVLDVKAGSGGVVGGIDEARELAQLCHDLGAAHDRQVRCLVTDMSQPLGDRVGNALEVRAALDVLSGAGDPRLRAVALALADEAFALAFGPHRPVAEEVLASGAALEKFREWVVAQGVDRRVAEELSSHLPEAPIARSVPASAAGFVHRVDPRVLGEVAVGLGAGRQRPGDRIDPSVGIVVHVRVGAEVAAGQPLVTVHGRSRTDANQAAVALRGAIIVDADASEDPGHPLVHARLPSDTGD